MKKDFIIEKLQKIFYECDRHLLRIDEAYHDLQDIMPLSEEDYINLSSYNVKTLDQFLFRFSKMQDAMGQKLFKNILLYLDEDIEGKPFIDILNLMEKIYLLDSVNDWKELREDRNELAHNYEDEPQQMSEIINKLYVKKELLENIYIKIKSYYVAKR